MNSEDLVLIDTCMWVPFFNRPQSDAKRAVDSLLRGDRGAIVGPIIAEGREERSSHRYIKKRGKPSNATLFVVDCTDGQQSQSGFRK